MRLLGLLLVPGIAWAQAPSPMDRIAPPPASMEMRAARTIMEAAGRTTPVVPQLPGFMQNGGQFVPGAAFMGTNPNSLPPGIFQSGDLFKGDVIIIK